MSQARKISPVPTSSRTSPLLHRPCLLRDSAASGRRGISHRLPCPQKKALTKARAFSLTTHHILRSENVDRVVDEDTNFVTFTVVSAGVVRNRQERVTQAQGQVFCRTVLYHVAQLAEDFTLGTATGVETVVDVVTVHVRHFVAQAWSYEGRQVDAVAQLPRTLVLAVEVGPVGVRQVDGVATVAVTAGTAIAAIGITGVADAALVGDGEGVDAQGVGSCQAPDFVVAVGWRDFLVQLGLVPVEVQGQRLAFR